MPYVQPLPWTEFITCPICTHSFGFFRRHPISLPCGHSVCRLCLASLYNQQCPFDQSPISVDHKNLPVNSALLLLVSLRKGGDRSVLETVCALPPPWMRELEPDDLRCFYVGKVCIEHLAIHLHNGIGIAENPLSRSMQRKLVTLIHCQLVTEEGRLRAIRVSRGIGERVVIKMIMRQQKPMQLSSCLWAAVRGRGCQFLGPVLQEDVLRHLLAALAGGVPLTRKSLVAQVVQSLKPEYSQASKTSVGHVVQLLYRASCFNVSKRECESSLMQLKEEFSTYDSLRQEHDAQIVNIAMEAGLRIPPEQWSTLLYGDQMHKSYMQSIIDRLQTPESFKQSIQELVITLQRNDDMSEFENMRPHLQDLANIETSTDKPPPTTWQELGKALKAVKNVVDCFLGFEIRVRKQLEERRLSQRNCNGVNPFGHPKIEANSSQNANNRSLQDIGQASHFGRPMMRPGMTSLSFSGPAASQYSNLGFFRQGGYIGIPIAIQQRLETMQTQSAPILQSNRSTQINKGKNQNLSTERSGISSFNVMEKSTQTTNITIPPPPGFEHVRPIPLNGRNMRRSCSSSIINGGVGSERNFTNSTIHRDGPVTLLQSPWPQRGGSSDWQQQQNLQAGQDELPNVIQSPSTSTEATSISSTSRLPSSTLNNENATINSEANDRPQIQELQKRFNEVVLNSSVEDRERSSSTTDSGVNSPSQSNADEIEVRLNRMKQQKFEKFQSQEPMPYRGWNSNPACSTSVSLISNSDRSGDDLKNPKMTSNVYENGNHFFNFDSEIKQESPKGSASESFGMEFPKSSQMVQLKLSNISKETLREIWQVPQEQKEAETIEDIWKPLQPGQEDPQPRLRKGPEDIRVRQQRQTNNGQQSILDQSYACMEAAYSKMSERYPHVGLGPWTDSSALTADNPDRNFTYSTSSPIAGMLGSQRPPEPSNLGLSALRMIAYLGDRYNFDSPGTIANPASQPYKTALDAAIETYWKDAMEASLNVNMFLPPANTARFPYPGAENMGVSPDISHGATPTQK